MIHIALAQRRYTTHCNYWLPVNTKEDSADEQIDRGISLQYVRKLWQAPFSNLQSILEIGCGRGLWLRDVYDQWHCRLVGIDIANRGSFCSPRSAFESDDPRLEWIGNPSAPFDLIYMSRMEGWFTREKWKALYKQAREKLELGGWIQQIAFPMIPRN